MTDIAPLRWGISSTGNIARSMATALRTLPDAELVAVGSRSQKSADGFAAEFSISHAHPSHEALCADPDVDIVYVASPHSEHRAMTIGALDAGKHVVCEKAFALNGTEAAEMVGAARRNGRFLMEAMWTWFIPAVIDIKARIAAGEIGSIISVDADFSIHVPNPDGRHRRPDLAGGALLDLGIYPLTFACFVLDEYPDDVRAIGRLTDDGVDATIGGVASYPGGAISTFRTSLEGFSTLDARIVGTGGRIDVKPPFWFASAFTVHQTGPHANQEPESVEISNDGLAHEAAHAMARIRDGHLESDVVTLDASMQTMRLLDDVRAQVGVVYPSET
jgi:predicted dehydrogenase